MTIAALLRHHGVRTPRFVTVAGQIVFDGVTASATGPVHSTYGPVTAVTPHHFHGGEEAEDILEPSRSEWWDDDTLIGRHLQAMEKSFPGFMYFEPGEDSCPAWGGLIDTGRGKFKVLVVLRRDGGLPRVIVTDHRMGANAGRRWQEPPHLFTNGNLCVADESDWISEEHTAATVTAWAAHWLAAYSEWRFTRRWPVEGVESVVA
ncbi:MAG: hypothetical protein ACPGVG_14405 [Mycobacterium sp.]